MNDLEIIARDVSRAIPSAKVMPRPSEDLTVEDSAIDVDLDGGSLFSIQVGFGYANLVERSGDDEAAILLHGHFNNSGEATSALLRIAGARELSVRPASIVPGLELSQAGLDPEATPVMLARLAVAGGQLTRMAVGNNRNAQPDLLDTLSRDPLETVRQAVAENPMTPPDALGRLTEDESAHVRQFAGGNPSTPPEALARLASRDTSTSVKTAVAGNSATPVDALTLLAALEARPEGRHGQTVLADIRAALSINPSTPSTVLQALGEHPRDGMRRVEVAMPERKPGSVRDRTTDRGR